MNKILVIAPHTDDAELGVGGTISRLLREGKEVYCMVLSGAVVNNEEGDTFKECERAMKVLGVKNLFISRHLIRYFYAERQNILQEIIEIKRGINPDTVFIPSTNDFHQDHKVVCEESIRAFKNVNILGYEYPWNNLKTNLNYFVKLDEQDIKKKINALKKYVSQEDRPYMRTGFVRNWAEINGIKINTKYAESFETIRMVK